MEKVRGKFSGPPMGLRQIVAIDIESLFGAEVSARAGDCKHALRQSSGALAVQTGLSTVANDPAATAFGRTSITPTQSYNIEACPWRAS